MKRLLLLFTLVGIASPVLVNAGESGQEILNTRCAYCHDLKGPAPQTIRELWKRDAPDLFFAGNKYRRDWLVSWLQKPVRVRPAGVNYLRAINSTPTSLTTTKKGRKYDVLWGKYLKPLQHESLTKAEAEVTVDVLMSMNQNYVLTSNETLDKSKAVSLDAGEVLVDKVYGCQSCHQIEPGYGGYTGPELYTAGKRLQPEFILSYIKQPKKWDPKIWMPNMHVKPGDLQKITNYLILLSKEDFNASK